MLKLSKPQSSHEELFMQRYERLRSWALHLVLGDQQQAEDLLHDAFIHFTLHKSVIEHVQNLDAYLNTMLRNLHLSQARRLARTPQGHLSLLDYDSADIGLQSIDPRDQIKVQDELRTICRYSCIRKQTSKAGSVLILRFFHGYYPAEIARLLKCPRAAVDSFLKGARGEAKLFLQNPDALTFIRDSAVQELPAFGFGRMSPDILTELRQTIFSSRHDQCLAQEQLETIYARDASELVNVATLNHLVSCPDCLDRVNKILDLPPLAMRQASETVGRDNRPKGGGGPAGGGTAGAGFLKRSRRRTKHVFEHRPKELHISVNGFVLGTQTISSRRSELTLNVNLDEKIAFIEVFSERDVRLFFLNVEMPPEGGVDQVSSIELSDGRELDLALNFSDTWPRLHAVYVDPTLEVESLQSEVFGVVQSPASNVQGLGTNPSVNEGSGREVQRPTSNVQSLSGKVAGLWTALRSRMSDVGPRTLDIGLLSRPAVVTLLLAAVLIGSLLILRNRTPVPLLSAAGLLEQAAINEQALLAKPNQVIHQSITLEERKSPGGELVAHRRIEVWQSAEKGIAARRLYDENGVLIAGEWKRGDGSRTLYSNKEKPNLAHVQFTASVPDSLDDAWLLEPSAQEFQRLTPRDASTIVEDTPAYYAVAYRPAVVQNSAESNLVNARIVFSKPDLRVIEQILLVQRGDQRREFRYIQAGYQALPARTVQPSVFEPERELLAALLKDLKIGSEPGAVATGSPEENAPAATAGGTAATADLEVEALNLVNQAGADTGEQVIVRRTGGVLRIDGVVDNTGRKNELIRALSPISRNPAVRINIMTVAEALQKEESRRQKGPVAVERFETGSSEVPVKDQLERYFGSEEAANKFASRAISRSRNAMSRAGALKRLIGQFTLAELKELSPDARAKWLALVRGHARGFAQETAALRSDLSPVFGGGAGGQSAPAINDDAALIRAVTRLFEIGAANDHAVRNALSISTDRSASALSQDLFRSLRTTESLAAAIQEYR